MAILCSCGGGPTQDVVIQRLIERTADTPIEHSHGAVRWQQSFNPPLTGESPWRFDQINSVDSSADHNLPTLTATGNDPKAITRFGLNAEDVGRIDLHGDGDINGSVLFWAGPGEPFTAEKRLRAEAIRPGRHVAFHVTRHPEWSGRIERIRLDPTSRPDGQFRLDRLVAINREIEHDSLEPLVHQPLSVELGGDLRPARVLAPGHAIRWPVSLQPGDTLRLATGAAPGFSGECTLSIRTEPESAELFRTTIRSEDAGEWVDAEFVTPSDLAAGPDHLVMSVDTGESWDSADGLAFVANPVVVRRGGPVAPNLLFVSIDTLRADHVSSCGYDRPTTPNLDHWFGQRGVVFTSMVASSPWTLPSHVTMFSGLDTLTHGANFGSIPNPDVTHLLAEILRPHGFTSAAWTGGAYLSPEFGLAAGFDTFHSWDTPLQSTELEENARALTDWVLANQDSRYFALLHTYEVHTPFRARQPYYSRYSGEDDGPGGFVNIENHSGRAEEGFLARKGFQFHADDGSHRSLSEDDRRLIVDLYDAGINHADAIIGTMLSDLAAAGALDDTVVVVTSDHGEGLGESGLFAHAYLYDFNLMVPFMISGPGVSEAGSVITDQVRMSDITPTILDLLGIEAPGPSDGISLAPLLSGREMDLPEEAWSYAPKTNRGVSLRRANRTKFIFNNTAWAPLWGTCELFDLADDPAESHNLAAEDDAAVGSYRHHAIEELEGFDHVLELVVSNPSDQSMGVQVFFEAADNLLGLQSQGPRRPPRDSPGRRQSFREDRDRTWRHFSNSVGGPAESIAARRRIW
jgi:arylsulfatase A-like enzyme